MSESKKEFYHNQFLLRLSLFVFLSLFILIPQGESQQESDLQKYLPKTINNTWQTTGESLAYINEDLYLYINGGAEIYHEYGFRSVLVQDYSNKNGVTISLEIYEMIDSTAAYGIYSFKSSASGEVFPIAAEGRLEDYYMNFWKGNYLVTLTGFDEEAETIQGLKDIAIKVSERLIGPSEPPGLVLLLPENGLVKASIKYFTGNLGLMNTLRDFSELFTSFTAGIKAEYRTGSVILIFKYDDSNESLSAFHDVKAKLKGSSTFTKPISIDDSSLLVKTTEDRLVQITVSQEYICTVVGTSLKQNQQMINSLTANLK